MIDEEDSEPADLPAIGDVETRLRIIENEIRGMKSSARLVSRFGKWLAGLAFMALGGLGGLAYDAHLTLANRLIQVTRLTEAQLGRVEERVEAQRQLLSLLLEKRQ